MTTDKETAMPHYSDDTLDLHVGDCLDIMRTLPDNSVDSIVTDPPYGLGFMGKAWDDLPPGVEWATECLRVLKPGGHLLAFGGSRTWHRLAAAVEDAGFEIRDSIAWLYGSGFPKSKTALKPSFEPCVVARKSCIGSERSNVERFGTGALQVDAARIGDEVRTFGGPEREREQSQSIGAFAGNRQAVTVVGRWPTNVAFDEAQAATLDESRYFYCSKAPAKERPKVDGVAHPTVKPLDLMRWLVRLVTPPGGTILEPFLGSGTTAEAARLEGFRCIGIERDESYLPLIEARLGITREALDDVPPWLREAA